MLKVIAVPYTVGQNRPSVPIGVVELSEDVDLRKSQMLDLFTQRVFSADSEELNNAIEIVMEQSQYGDFYVHYDAEIFLYFHIV